MHTCTFALYCRTLCTLLLVVVFYYCIPWHFCTLLLYCKGVKGVLVLESIAHYCSYALYCTVLVLQAIALHCTPVHNCTIALLKGSYYWTPCTIAGWCRVSLRGVGVVGIRGAAGGIRGCRRDMRRGIEDLLLLFSNFYFQQTSSTF